MFLILYIPFFEISELCMLVTTILALEWIEFGVNGVVGSVTIKETQRVLNPGGFVQELRLFIASTAAAEAATITSSSMAATE